MMTDTGTVSAAKSDRVGHIVFDACPCCPVGPSFFSYVDSLRPLYLMRTRGIRGAVSPPAG